MKKVIVVITEGFEEMETVVPIDILDRAGIDVKLASITGKLEVKGCHGVTIIADTLFDVTNASDADLIILPGGPGAASYIDCKTLSDTLTRRNKEGKLIAAICAAPVTLGKLGILDNKNATCFPAKAADLISKARIDDHVVIDGNIITGKAAGSAIDFGFALVSILSGKEKADAVRAAMCITSSDIQ